MIRPAQRSQAKPLIGFYAESGGGKTHSALLLARGFVGPQGRICMIETEQGRGEAFVDMIPGGYDVRPMRDNFSPKSYNEALREVEKEGFDALIIDSARLKLASLSESKFSRSGSRVSLRPSLGVMRGDPLFSESWICCKRASGVSANAEVAYSFIA